MAKVVNFSKKGKDIHSDQDNSQNNDEEGLSSRRKIFGKTKSNKSSALKSKLKDELVSKSWNLTDKDKQYPASKSFQRQEVDLNEKYIATKKRRKRNKFLKIFLFVGVMPTIFIALLSYFLIASPVFAIRSAVNELQDELNLLVTDVGEKDLSNFDLRVDNISKNLDKIDANLNDFSYLKSFGFTKGYYENIKLIDQIISEGNDLLKEIAPSIRNTLKISGFSENPGNVNEKEETSFNLILRDMPIYISLYETIEPDLISITNKISQIDPEFLPSIGSLDLKSKLANVQEITKSFPDISQQAMDLLAQAPELLGAESETNFLVVLQNETEMRASGGLLTAYGIMTIENGEIKDDISLTDMWNLENYISSYLGIDTGYRNIYGQLYLMVNGCGGSWLRAQDSGIYPDLNWTMKTFTEYYEIAREYDPETYPDYDHVIILNHHFAESLIRLIEPLEVEGYGEVTAENLFDFIKAETDDPSLSYDPDRKAILGEVATAAKEKFADLSSDDLPNVVDTIIKSVYAKDIALYSEDQEMQAYFDQYDLSGRIVSDFDGDYFHLNEAQNCSLKLNKFLRDSVEIDVNIDSAGSVSKDVKTEWVNEVVYKDEFDKQYDTTGNFTYRAWVRLFSPEDSVYTFSDGLKASNVFPYRPVEYFDDEVGKEVSDNVIQFNHIRLTENDPIKTRELNVSVDSPASINYLLNNEYKLLIQKHPGKSWGEEYTIRINYEGNVYEISFILDQDKVVTFKNGMISLENYHTSLDWVKDLVS